MDENITRSSKKCAAVMLLDLKGAFESVDRVSLTCNVITYYISKFSPKLTNLVKSYLTNSLATIYNTNHPDDNTRLEYMMNRNVPQGSKVSPLLFLIATCLVLKWINNRLKDYQNKLKGVLRVATG